MAEFESLTNDACQAVKAWYADSQSPDIPDILSKLTLLRVYWDVYKSNGDIRKICEGLATSLQFGQDKAAAGSFLEFLKQALLLAMDVVKRANHDQSDKESTCTTTPRALKLRPNSADENTPDAVAKRLKLSPLQHDPEGATDFCGSASLSVGGCKQGKIPWIERRKQFISFATNALAENEKLNCKQIIQMYCNENPPNNPNGVKLFFSNPTNRKGTGEYLTLKSLKKAASILNEERRRLSSHTGSLSCRFPNEDQTEIAAAAVTMHSATTKSDENAASESWLDAAPEEEEAEAAADNNNAIFEAAITSSESFIDGHMATRKEFCSDAAAAVGAAPATNHEKEAATAAAAAAFPQDPKTLGCAQTAPGSCNDAVAAETNAAAATCDEEVDMDPTATLARHVSAEQVIIRDVQSALGSCNDAASAESAVLSTDHEKEGFEVDPAAAEETNEAAAACDEEVDMDSAATLARHVSAEQVIIRDVQSALGSCNDAASAESAAAATDHEKEGFEDAPASAESTEAATDHEKEGFEVAPAAAAAAFQNLKSSSSAQTASGSGKDADAAETGTAPAACDDVVDMDTVDDNIKAATASVASSASSLASQDSTVTMKTMTISVGHAASGSLKDSAATAKTKAHSSAIKRKEPESKLQERASREAQSKVNGEKQKKTSGSSVTRKEQESLVKLNPGSEDRASREAQSKVNGEKLKRPSSSSGTRKEQESLVQLNPGSDSIGQKKRKQAVQIKVNNKFTDLAPLQGMMSTGAGQPVWLCGLISHDTRTSHKHLNWQAVDNCPIGGPYQRAYSKDLLLNETGGEPIPMTTAAAEAVEEVEASQGSPTPIRKLVQSQAWPDAAAGGQEGGDRDTEVIVIDDEVSVSAMADDVDRTVALSTQGTGRARVVYIHQSVCRSIWALLVSHPDPLEKRILRTCQQTSLDTELETDSLMLSAMFPLNLVKCVAPADIQLLNQMLEQSTTSSAVQLEMFRETILAIFSSIALECAGVKNMQSFEAKANSLQHRFIQELKNRVNQLCSACGRPGPVFLCSCGEGYCTACCGDPCTEYVQISCLMCRLDQAGVSPYSGPVSDIVRFQSVRQCLNCHRLARAHCSACGTPFCQRCALGLPEVQAERKGWRCILCTGAFHWHLTNVDTLREIEVKYRGNVELLSAHHWCLLCCGLGTIADGLLHALCNKATAQMMVSGSKTFITPQQIIVSLGRSSIVSTRLLSRILEVRTEHSKVEAGKAEARAIACATRHKLRKSSRKSGPLRVGYFLSPDLWNLAMLEAIAPWLRRFDRLQFSLSLVCFSSNDEPHSIQALQKILEGVDDISWLIIGKDLLDEEAYQMVCSAELDIAVDLDCGCGERSSLKAMRGIAYKIVYAVGLPCPEPKMTEKSKTCDFVLGDDRALPAELRIAWKGLTPILKVSLARPFWVSRAIAARRTNSTKREDFQFPPVGFIFMHVEEISPANPEAMRLMLSIVYGTPGSCLVMFGQTQLARAYLRRESFEFKRDHSDFDHRLRVLYRHWPESTEERVKLMSHGDLLLATSEGGSVTAAGLLALAACLPVLVRVAASDSEKGQTGFGVQRDIYSALWYVGLTDELVVRSVDQFCEKAMDLGNHQGRVLQLKQHLVDQEAAETGFFSEDRQVREWEHGLKKLSKLKANSGTGNDIDATLDEYMQRKQFRMKSIADCLAPPNQGSALGAALARESILNQMTNAHKEFDNPSARAQLDSLLEDFQERGVCLIMQGGTGAFCSVVLGRMNDLSNLRGVLPGQKLAIVFERRKRSAVRLYNGLLFRYAHNITVNRRRKQFDKFMVQPVRLFENGSSFFSVSYPDENGESICCLVLEGLDSGFLDNLKDDVKSWTDHCRLADSLRYEMQHTLYALNTFHDNSIVHRDIKPNNIMRNGDGNSVFIDWGSGWVFGGSCSIVQRRTTSSMVVNSGNDRIKGLSKVNLAALNVGRRVKEAAVKKHLPQSSLSRDKSKKRNASTARTHQHVDSRLPDEKKPCYLSDHAMRAIVRSLAERGEPLATLGNGTVLFRREDLWSESGRELTLERAKKQDVYALFRTFMMLFRPLKSMSHTQWEREAIRAAESVPSMQNFLLDGGRLPLQPRAFARLADFLFSGINNLNLKEAQTHEFVTLPVYREEIEHSICHGTGFLVKGGEMSTVPGCPFPMYKLKDVLVIREGEIGAGLKAVEPYEEHEIITFYYAAQRVGLEINEDPPGRYIVAIHPQHLYGNGEFTPTLTLETFGEKKAMGVCINAPMVAKKRNCYLMRLHTKTDEVDSKYLWIPVRAARRIAAGEYFSYNYDHEAGGGLLRGYNFRVKKR